MTPEDAVKAAAREVGFSVVGIADAAPTTEEVAAYDRWLERGMHGGMAYLERHRGARADVTELLPGARSAVCVGVNYYQVAERVQRELKPADGKPTFSIYVHGEDYHAVVESMLADLDARLRETFPEMESLICVDTKPVSDRAMALRAGIAWLGKNTSAISPEFGTWVFLGELVTNLALTPDPPLESLCGKCTRCVDACPTGALDEPFMLDARKCISYLTIENRGDIPSELQDKIGVNVYGCDTCQSVCPFNRVAEQTAVFDAARRSPLVDMSLDDLAAISEVEFRELTAGSAIRRCKAEGMRRNATVVRENIRRAAS